jgi:hypothetical protein
MNISASVKKNKVRQVEVGIKNVFMAFWVAGSL